MPAPSNSDPGQRIDAAALAAATVAGALAVFLVEGPFDPLNGVVGATLLTIVYGYEWNRPRTVPQSVALSAVSSFSALLIVGLLSELVLGGGSLEGVLENGKRVSRVSSWWLTAVWLVLLAVLTFLDRRHQGNAHA